MPTNDETNAARLLEPSPATRLIISFLMMTSTLSNSFLQLFHPKMPSQWPDSSTSNKAFGEDRQPPAAVQGVPPIDSRTGQHPSFVTNQQQRRVITTDLHKRVAAPNRQCNSRHYCPGNQRCCPTGTQQAAAAVDPQDDPGNDQ